MVPVILQAAGAALLILFAYACWAPLALLLSGLVLLFFGVAFEKPKPVVESRS